MKPFFSSRIKKLRALVFLNAIMLGFIGVAHAHPENQEGENLLKPAVTEEKSENKQGSLNEAGLINKNQSRQEEGQGAGNYKGVQPPQGGRIGQGGFVN